MCLGSVVDKRPLVVSRQHYAQPASRISINQSDSIIVSAFNTALLPRRALGIRAGIKSIEIGIIHKSIEIGIIHEVASAAAGHH